MPISKKGKVPNLDLATKKMRRTLPLVVANMAKNHYVEGFRRGGGRTDKSRGGWKQRKKQDKQAGRRAILIKSGQLRNDVDVRKTTFEEIVLGTTDTIYADVHNEGLQAGRGSGFTMPQREFLGPSRQLDKKVRRRIIREFNKAFKL